MSLRCLIIDDEPVARKVLRKYVNDAPGLELVQECRNALEGLEILKEVSIDLLFLDINMPKLSGLSFLKSLNDPPLVVLTTAYSEYALESYELDVVDYLLKPFSFERFLKAVNKARVTADLSSSSDITQTIKADGKTYRIAEADILYVESMGDYLTLHTTDKKLTFNRTLKSFLEELSHEHFLQVHKSFIVGFNHIDYVEGNLIYLKNGQDIPVGNAFKDQFKNRFLR